MNAHPLKSKVAQAFRARFLHEPALVVRAPGRINLIGGHTDYNDGFVLPMAVDRAAWVAVAARRDTEARIRALDMGGDEVAFSTDRVPASDGGWSDYARGIVWAFLEQDLTPPGMEGVLTSDVPVGAGMSSSAAVEVAFAYSWACLAGWDLADTDLARLAQRAEREYVGVNCGIMDQMISVGGRAGHAMLLDTRSMDREYVPVPDEVAVLVADSGVRRSLAASKYNQRRAQCEQAVGMLQEVLPQIKALRDVTPDDLEAHRSVLPELLFRRARHVVHENQRVHRVVAALEQGALDLAGALLLEAHRSLRDDYEVSAPELDTLVEAASEVRGCYGARLTGAGFGGCIIALVAEEAIPDVEAHLRQAYAAEFDRNLSIYTVRPASGVASFIPD